MTSSSDTARATKKGVRRPGEDRLASRYTSERSPAAALEQRVDERGDGGVRGGENQEANEHDRDDQRGQPQQLVTGEEMTELRKKPHAPIPPAPRRDGSGAKLPRFAGLADANLDSGRRAPRARICHLLTRTSRASNPRRKAVAVVEC